MGTWTIWRVDGDDATSMNAYGEPEQMRRLAAQMQDAEPPGSTARFEAMDVGGSPFDAAGGEQDA